MNSRPDPRRASADAMFEYVADRMLARPTVEQSRRTQIHELEKWVRNLVGLRNDYEQRINGLVGRMRREGLK